MSGHSTMHTDSIKVGDRFRKDLGAIDDLVDSIREVGLLQPIVVDADGNLIAGERRLMACQRLGWKSIPVTIVDLDDAHRLRAEHDENTIRQAFTRSEAVAIAKAIKDRVKTPVGKHVDQRDSETFAISGRTADKAAEFVGMSGRTLEKATAVVEAAEADPALVPVVEEMDRTGKVDPAYQTVREFSPGPDYWKDKMRQSDRTRQREHKKANDRQSEIVADKLRILHKKYGHLKRWQPVWDAYRQVAKLSPLPSDDGDDGDPQ